MLSSSTTITKLAPNRIFLVLLLITCIVVIVSLTLTIKAAVIPWKQTNYDAQGSRRAPFTSTHNDYSQLLPPINDTFEYSSMAMIYHSGWNRFLIGTIKVENIQGVGTRKYLSGMITIDSLTGKVVNGAGFTMESKQSLMSSILLSTKGYLYIPTMTSADFKTYNYLFVVNTLDWSLSKYSIESSSCSILVESVKCYIYVKGKSMKCLDMDNPSNIKWTLDVPESFIYSDSSSKLLLVNENNEEIIYYNGMKSISKISPKQVKILSSIELGNVIQIQYSGLSSFIIATVRTENAGDSFGIVHLDSKTSSFSNGIGLTSTSLFTSVTCIETSSTSKPNTFTFKTLTYLNALGTNSGPSTKYIYHFTTNISNNNNGGVLIEKPQLFKVNELKSRTFSHASISKDNCQIILYRNGMYSKLDLKTANFIMNVGSVSKGEAFDHYMLGADNGRVYTIVGNGKSFFESIYLM